MRQGHSQTRKSKALASIVGAMLLYATGAEVTAQQPTSYDAGSYNPAYAAPVDYTPAGASESWINSTQPIAQGPIVVPPPPNVMPAPGPGMGTGPGPYYSQDPQQLTPPIPNGGNYHPYPGVDQYQYAQQQTIFQKGMWFNEKLAYSRKYHGSAEYMQFIYDDLPNNLFGYEGGKGGVPQQSSASMPRSQDDFDTNGFGPVAQDNWIGFRPKIFSEMNGSETRAPGFRVNWGFENEDGSGLDITGFFGQEAVAKWEVGTVPYSTFDDPRSIEQLLFPLTLNALNPSISVDDGTGTAFTIPFDQYFEFRSHQQVYGAGFLISKTPWMRGDWYSLKPVYGLRYVNLQRGFNFKGFDSGAEYDYNGYTNNTPQNQQDLEAYINGVRNYTETGDPDFTSYPAGLPSDTPVYVPTGAGFVSPVNNQIFFATDAYETQIITDTQSYLAGPEVGLVLELGSEDFGLDMQVTGGIAANYETMKLSGFGVFNHFISTTGQAASDAQTQNIQAQSGFSSKDNSTHVSPFMEASLTAHWRVFKHIPGVNKYAIMQKANLTASGGYMYLGEVVSPYKSVNYVTWPINPSISMDRDGWELKYCTVGIDFNY